MNFLYCANQGAKDNHADFFSALEKEYQATEFSKDHDLDQSVIILVGGDGTLNHFLQNISIADANKIESIIYFPAGTANDFARSLGIAKTKPSVSKALSVLEGQKRLLVPVMTCNDRFFINAVSVGAPAKVTSSGDDLIKKATGKLSYYLNALEELLSPDIFEFSFSVDDGPWEQFSSFGALISQGLFAGGGVKISPSYCAHFGRSFGFTTVASTEISETLKILFEAQSENFAPSSHEKLISHLCQKLELSSNRPLPLKLDGEDYESQRLVFQKSDRSLPFLLH